MTNLYKYDLNLLTVFDMIYSEKHLTRAGQKLNLSQPAVSQALGKLRDLFGDALFIREGKDMIPTPFADQIYTKVHEIIKLSEQAFVDRGCFNPLTSNRIFKMAMNDYTEMVIMPKLFYEIRKSAPNIQLRSLHLPLVDQKTLNGDVDVVLASVVLASDINFGANIYQKSLFNDREVIIVRRGHPILKEELTPEKYVSLKHAQFKHSDLSISHIDLELNKMGLNRDIVLEVHHEMVLPLLMNESENDLAINIPYRMAKVFKDILPIEIIEIPFFDLEYNFCQYWHVKNNMDESHTWLRNIINQVAESL